MTNSCTIHYLFRQRRYLWIINIENVKKTYTAGYERCFCGLTAANRSYLNIQLIMQDGSVIGLPYL
jgi:hypothetical protein